MTINIAIAVAEGLVMAADGMTHVNAPDGSTIKHFPTAEKLTEIGGLPIAVMVHGVGAIQNRSILSLIREFEFDTFGKDSRGATSGAATPQLPASVKEVADALATFLQQRYDAAQWGDPPPPRPGVPTQPFPPRLGVIIGGYSPREFFPEVFEITFPGRNVLQKHPSPDAVGSPSVTWWGVTSSLNRLLVGFDLDALTQAYDFLKQAHAAAGQAGNPQAASQLLPLPKCTPAESLQPLGRLVQMRAVLDYMPLQEAVEFAEYLGKVAIGFSRFSAGLPLVGGGIDVLAIQPEGLCWHKRRNFSANMARARLRKL